MLPATVELSPFWTLVDFAGAKHAVADHAALAIAPGCATAVLEQVAIAPIEVSSLVAALGVRAPAAEVYYALMQLIAAGVVRAAPGAESAPPPTPADRSALPEISPAAASAPRRVFIDTPHEPRRDLVRACAAAAGHTVVASADAAEVHVLLVDHYFDPAIAAISAAARAARRDFVVAKPQGLAPWIGPLVLADRAPCFACLLVRLRGNQPLQEIALRGPRPYRCALVPDLEAHAARFLVSHLAPPISGAGDAPASHAGMLWTWQPEDAQWRAHHIIPRPQCGVCGGAASIAARSPSPLILRSRLKARAADGTSRVPRSPEILPELESHVDPLTGTINRVWRVTDVPAGLGEHARATHAYGEAPPRLPLHSPPSLSVAAGKGRTAEQARAAALAEACERYALLRFAKEHPATLAATAELALGAFLAPEALLGFSAEQYRRRGDWRGLHGTDYVPPPRPPEIPLAWVPAWSLVHERTVQVPRALVSPAAGDDSTPWAIADSNGSAAGATLEEAIVAGACELIERDAVGLWWYHRLTRPALDLDSAPGAALQSTRAALAREGFALHVLDLTTDLDVPVFAALAVERATGDIIPGFGAHLDPAIALERAVDEIGQAWSARELFSLRELARAYGHPEIAQHSFLQPPAGLALRPWTALRNRATDDVRSDIVFLTQAFVRRGFDFLVLDASLPDLPVRVAKTIAPGLAHFWPRFGVERLYTAPVQLQGQDARATEETFNPVPLVF